jgi:hypothetical protein
VLTPRRRSYPNREDLQEQLDCFAQEIEEQGGDAWVLPVTELGQVEERKVQVQMRADRQAEYEELRTDARALLMRAAEHPGPGGDRALRGSVVCDALYAYCRRTGAAAFEL